MNQRNMNRVFASLERDFYSRRDCRYKIGYEDLRQAIAAADSYMDRIAIMRGPMVPYFCSRHSCWHTGHNNKMAGSIASRYSDTCLTRERLRREIRILEGLVYTDHGTGPAHPDGLGIP